MNNTAIFKEIFAAIIPNNKTEWSLFILFFSGYAICGISLIINTDLLYNPNNLGAGSYLGYDNFAHSLNSGGSMDVSHPFLVFFYFLRFTITSLLSLIAGKKAQIFFCVLLMNTLISCGLVVLYKYLKNIIQVSTFRGILLTILCGSFFTVIVLSFTTESYPFSFLFLILSIYILSKEYITKNRFNASSVAVLSLMTGGITITNFFKPLTSILLNNDSWKIKVNKLLKISILFFVLVLTMYLLYSLKSDVTTDGKDYSVNLTIQNILRYLYFSPNWLKESFMDYWSSSFLIAPLTPQTVGFETVLRPSLYPYIWQYGLSISFFVFFIISLCLNRKNILVKFLFGYIIIDFVIHFIFRYGMNEAIIFGGHWVFLIPIMLGWLYSVIKHIQKVDIILDIYVGISVILLLMNNITEILHSFFSY